MHISETRSRVNAPRTDSHLAAGRKSSESEIEETTRKTQVTAQSNLKETSRPLGEDTAFVLSLGVGGIVSYAVGRSAALILGPIAVIGTFLAQYALDLVEPNPPTPPDYTRSDSEDSDDGGYTNAVAFNWSPPICEENHSVFTYD